MKALRKYLLLAVTVLCGFIPALSQPCTDCSSAGDFEMYLRNGLSGVEYRDQIQGYAGSQYLGDWRPGDITLKNGDVIHNIILLYDRYSDELLWQRQSDYRIGVVPNDNISGFHLTGNITQKPAIFIRKEIHLPFYGTFEAYVEILTQGKLGIYAYRNIVKDPLNPELADNTKYFVSLDNRDYVVLLRRKSILALPDIQKVEMKKILRGNRIAIRNNERGLVRAIEQYNLMFYDYR